MQQLIEKKLANNARAAMGSGMEHPIGSKTLKTTAAMKDVDIKNDLDGDISNMKMSYRLWMSAISDVKKGMNE